MAKIFRIKNPMLRWFAGLVILFLKSLLSSIPFFIACLAVGWLLDLIGLNWVRTKEEVDFFGRVVQLLVLGFIPLALLFLVIVSRRHIKKEGEKYFGSIAKRR